MIRFKEDISAAQERLEAWWEGKDPGRALIQARGTRPEPVYRIAAPEPRDHHDFWTNPEVVLPRLLNEMGATWFGAEAFPVLFPVPGRMVSILCKYLGAPNVYLDNETTWSAPIIEDWENPPPLEWNPDNEWWRITMRNMQRGADYIRKHELDSFMGLPDLNGPTEVLSGLRNPEKMCIDLVMDPEPVKAAARQVQAAWFEAWKGTSEIAHQFGGYFNWMRLWSETPAIDLQSDFSSLIGPEMFEEFILPFIVEQAQAFPRSIFHLDGPDMIRHLDLLLQVEEINAVQWVQGAGAGKVSDWPEVMRRIQNAGKRLYVYCKPDEVETLLKSCDPQGLMMVIDVEISQAEAEELVRRVERLS